MFKKISALMILIVLGMIIPVSSFAQADILDSLITAKLSPKVPGANEDVTISLNSYSADLDGSAIVWYLNKEAIKDGVGLTSVTIHTGDFGQKSIVDVVIVTSGGRRITKQIVIAPAEVDVLWEAQTYTPPFYKGKALPTYKSLVKMTAIPRFNTLTSDPSQYYYNWTYQQTLNVGKGLGKNSAMIVMGFPTTAIPVTVDVSLPGTDWSGTKSTMVSGTNPKILFYEQAPLLGTQFNSGLNQTVKAAGNQFTLRAVPYFFSLDDFQNGNLRYTWTVNGVDTVPGVDPTVQTVTKSGTGEELFPITLRMQDIKRVLQQAFARTTISLPSEQ